jgi:hypothetical protein
MKAAPTLIPVVYPAIGQKYHTSWSKNPWMQWTLMRINSDGTCILASKLSRFETKTTDLRAIAPPGKRSKQDAEQLVLTFEKTLSL